MGLLPNCVFSSLSETVFETVFHPSFPFLTKIRFGLLREATDELVSAARAWCRLSLVLSLLLFLLSAFLIFNDPSEAGVYLAAP